MTNWEHLLNPDIQNFMASHKDEDVKALGLKKPPHTDWPYALILDQIKARQKAKTKLPLWQSHNDAIIFPPSDLLEQASSAATARYKAALVKGSTFIDLTAGCGVDSCAMTEHFSSGICIEHNQNAADLLAHNLPLLTEVPVKIMHDTAEDFIRDMPETDLVYIDPQRRDESRKGFFRLEDCAPNIIDLISHIKDRAKFLMIKTSPMLDISTALKSLQNVAYVHIVEWKNECKEVLYILDFENNEQPVFTVVNINDDGEAINELRFTQQEETQNSAPLSQPLKYLYEPGPAFQKSGAFNTLATKFEGHKLHKHTHLYTSETYCGEFPGRHFEILEILPVDRKVLPMKKANLSIRNFPSGVAQLKKKLKLKDGGQDYLFACTLSDEKKALLHCRKIRKNL